MSSPYAPEASPLPYFYHSNDALNSSYEDSPDSDQKRLSSFSSGLSSAEANKRGRPRSEALTSLMMEGSTSPSAIKCKFCHRVFPRDKSLQAHLRTHTGERPYTCDYPGCTRAFTQSGQLKTHQRLHTGERPFICSALNCPQRFTHANRHCPEHPYDPLKRCDDDLVMPTMPDEHNSDIQKWLQRYREDRLQVQVVTPTTRKTPKRAGDENKRRFKKFGSGTPPRPNLENLEGTSRSDLELTPNILLNSPLKGVRKGLMCELDMNVQNQAMGSPLSSAKAKAHPPKVILWKEPCDNEDEYDRTPLAWNNTRLEVPEVLETPVLRAPPLFNPKKKWLRDSWQDDLGTRPLEPSQERVMGQTWQMGSGVLVDPNQNRPTVLMVAGRGSEPVQDHRKWVGALALMQLATRDDLKVDQSGSST